jgi:hypothetical protein
MREVFGFSPKNFALDWKQAEIPLFWGNGGGADPGPITTTNLAGKHWFFTQWHEQCCFYKFRKSAGNWCNLRDSRELAEWQPRTR